MKKTLSFLLMLAIMLLPVSALAAPGDAILLRSGENGFTGSLRGMAEVDGDLYLLTYEALYTLEAGATTPERHELALVEDAAVDVVEPAGGETSETDASQTALSEAVASVLRNFGAQEQAAQDAAGGASDNVAQNTNREAVAILAYGGRPCLVVSQTTVETRGSGDDMEYFSTVDGVWLYELAFNTAGDAVTGEEIVKLDWLDLVQGDGDYEYLAQCTMPFVIDNTLYFRSYDYNGNEFIAMTNLTDGSTDMLYGSELGADVRLDTICPYKDGKLLALSIEWGEDGNTVKLHTINVAEAALEELTEIPSQGYAYPTGLVYREENDTLYFVMNGEVYTMTGMDVSTLQSVAEIPVANVYDAMPIVTDDGFYIAGDYEVVARRNTDPSLRAQISLTVQNNYNTSISNAYYTFTNEHGDVEVIMTQQVEDIVQAMMNRSTAVDIYCLNVSSSEYEAVFSRGYMADLSGSEALTALVESSYPFVQEVCKKDGQVVAIPVEMYTNGRGYDPAAFERLGLTEEDVPQTWVEFFEGLEPLAEKVAEVPGMSLFETYYDYESVRMTFLNAMINDYMCYISQPENEFAFDTEAFRAALAAYESVDWSALGMPAPDTDDGLAGGVISIGGPGEQEHNVVYSSYANVSADSYAVRETFSPLLLRFEEGKDAQINADMYVAFVSPFSENPEEAVAFLETVAGELDDLLKIHISPDNNEPVKSPYYETSLAEYDQMIADAKEQLAQADEADKPNFEELVAQYEQYREEYMQYGAWSASEESIARYRTFASHIRVTRNIGLGGENADEFYELTSQYMDGMISADEFITGVDRKLQMMMKEGM